MDAQEVNDASTTHGRKRHAEDNLEHEQRLAKRFNLLNLDNSNKLYMPVKRSEPTILPRQHAIDDSMQLDNTKDKVYVYNLDDEIQDIEAEEKLVFLPDIEKRLGKIPQHVLTGRKPPTTSSELILYSVPESLSIPLEQDKVRKAIIESRARARETQAQEEEPLQGGRNAPLETTNGVGYSMKHHRDGGPSVEVGHDDYEDAMEIG